MSLALVFAGVALLASMVVRRDRQLRSQLSDGLRQARLDKVELRALLQAQALSIEEFQADIAEASRRLEHEQGRHSDAIRKDVTAELRRLQNDTDKLLRERQGKALRVHEERSARDFRQLEALLALYQDTKAEVGFPTTRAWAASPDLLLFLHGLVIEEAPKVIVECGSGLSTVILAYALRDAGGGIVVSLEHLEEHHDTTIRMLQRHGVESWADVRLAPLVSLEIAEESWSWYSPSSLPSGEVDLLVVDGPPGRTGPNARFPALPLLRDRLAPTASVVMDDYARDDEKQVVQRWLEMYDDFRVTTVAHEKGTAILRRE